MRFLVVHLLLVPNLMCTWDKNDERINRNKRFDSRLTEPLRNRVSAEKIPDRFQTADMCRARVPVNIASITVGNWRKKLAACPLI